MSKEQENGVNYTGIFMIIAFLIISFSLIYPKLLDYFVPDDQNEFGDSYGMLNSVFSGLAFAGVIVTVWMQKSELSDQREELKLQRREFLINRITNIIYKQTELINIYIDDFTFFNEVGAEINGERGLIQLNSKRLRYTDYNHLCKLIENKNHLEKLKNEFRLYESHEKSLEILYTNIAKSVLVVNYVINGSNLLVEEKKSLIAVYALNAGRVYPNLLEALANWHINFSQLKIDKRFQLISDDYQLMGYVNNTEDLLGKISVTGKKALSFIKESRKEMLNEFEMGE
jgi:hypothetical protein